MKKILNLLAISTLSVTSGGGLKSFLHPNDILLTKQSNQKAVYLKKDDLNPSFTFENLNFKIANCLTLSQNIAFLEKIPTAKHKANTCNIFLFNNQKPIDKKIMDLNKVIQGGNNYVSIINENQVIVFDQDWNVWLLDISNLDQPLWINLNKKGDGFCDINDKIGVFCDMNHQALLLNIENVKNPVWIDLSKKGSLAMRVNNNFAILKEANSKNALLIDVKGNVENLNFTLSQFLIINNTLSVVSTIDRQIFLIDTSQPIGKKTTNLKQNSFRLMPFSNNYFVLIDQANVAWLLDIRNTNQPILKNLGKKGKFFFKINSENGIFIDNMGNSYLLKIDNNDNFTFTSLNKKGFIFTSLNDQAGIFTERNGAAWLLELNSKNKYQLTFLNKKGFCRKLNDKTAVFRDINKNAWLLKLN